MQNDLTLMGFNRTFSRISLQGGPKNWHTVLYTLTSSNIDRFQIYFTVRIRRTFV